MAEGVRLLFLALARDPDTDRRGLTALAQEAPARLVSLGPLPPGVPDLALGLGLPAPEEGDPLPPDLSTPDLLERLEALARSTGPGACLGLLAPPEVVREAVAGVLGLGPGQRGRVIIPPGSLNRLDRLPDRWVVAFTGETCEPEGEDGPTP